MSLTTPRPTGGLPILTDSASVTYTADRNIPGAFEGETVTRRGFMTGGAMAAGGVATAAFGLPAQPGSAAG